MIVDGKVLAQELYSTLTSQVAGMSFVPRLAIVTCAPDFGTQKYISLKQARADMIGVAVTLLDHPFETTTETLVAQITQAVDVHHGVIVQLPLPAHIDTDAVLAAIPASHDVDALASTDIVLSPVAAAIDHISAVHGVIWAGKDVVIFGQGRLVGKPVAQYAAKHGAVVHIVTENTADPQLLTMAADIIVLGVGKPDVLKTTAVKEGVVVFDAGASEDSGVLRGDAEAAVADIASLFTPVPGGIGPLTLAFLFSNLVKLATRQ